MANGCEPKFVIADRGYDSAENSEWLRDNWIDPIIHIRKPPSGKRSVEGSNLEFDKDGVPLCECGEPRPFLYTDSATGRHVYGPMENCNRGGKLQIPGIADCDLAVSVDPAWDRRLFGGGVRRGSGEWKRLYRKRWSAERPFSALKHRGIADSHCFRGHGKINLHLTLANIAALAVELSKSKSRAADEPPLAA